MGRPYEGVRAGSPRQPAGQRPGLLRRAPLLSAAPAPRPPRAPPPSSPPARLAAAAAGADASGAARSHGREPRLGEPPHQELQEQGPRCGDDAKTQK